MPVRIVADRLYALTFRPQELALYGAHARCTLSYDAMAEDPAAVTAAHFKLLVLEIACAIPPEPGASLPAQGQAEIDVLKAGWELELHADPPCRAEDLPETPEELRLLLTRIADTIAPLAQRAGIDPPVTPELIQQLLLERR